MTFKSLPKADGSIQGIVKAFNTDAPIDGVTVIATSPALGGGLKGITDGKGFYKIAPLPPGEYLVTFYYDDITAERSHVLVSVDMATPVFQILHIGPDDPVVHTTMELRRSSLFHQRGHCRPCVIDENFAGCRRRAGRRNRCVARMRLRTSAAAGPCVSS